MAYGIHQDIIIDFETPLYVNKKMHEVEECFAAEGASFNYLALLDELDQDVKEANLDGKLTDSQARKIFARYGI